MFAYVKFDKKCTRHEEKHIVPVSSINHFDVKNVGNRNKSYKVKCGTSGYCTGIIIFVEDTIQKLNDKIATKRQVIPPKDFIQSASEISASENESAGSGENQALKIQNELRLKKALDDKTKALVKKQASAKKSIAANEKTDRSKAVEGHEGQDKSHEKKAKEQGSGTVKRKASSDADNSTKVSARSGNDKQEAEIVTSAIKKIKQHSTDGINKENQSPTVLGNNIEKKKPDIRVPQKKTIYMECNNSEHFALVEELQYLEEKCSRSEKKITEQELLIKELTTLNMQLQREVIQYFSEFKAMAKQYEGAIRNLEDADTPPVAFTRKTDNTIHLGRNVWIPKIKYDYAVRMAKTNQLFVKEIAMAVFGLEVLQNSSVTGMKCNRFKDRKAKPKLEDVKILAIQDIYRYWLIKAKKCTECEAQSESCKVQLYISRKICDLNRTLAGTSSASTESTEDAVLVGTTEGNRGSLSDNNEDSVIELRSDDGEDMKSGTPNLSESEEEEKDDNENAQGHANQQELSEGAEEQ